MVIRIWQSDADPDQNNFDLDPKWCESGSGEMMLNRDLEHTRVAILSVVDPDPHGSASFW
jgi:hypothetical protein